MNIRQQITQSNIEKIANNQNIDEDEAFLKFIYSIYTDKSIYSLDSSDDIVDGGEDKQIDVISIEENDGEATVYILQVKNTKSFSSNTIIQIRNGLHWIFNKPRSDVSNLSNKAFKDRILAYRAVQNDLGPSNIHIKVLYATNTDVSTTPISNECLQEKKTTEDQYDNDTFASFTFELWSSDEIIECLNKIEKRNKKIDADIKIKYDINTPSLIRHYGQGIPGIVCTVSASEIAKIINEDINNYIFDLNIRRYLGNRGNVNKDIYKTCTEVDSSSLFWFLNNGITIVCDYMDTVTDPDNPHIKIKNMQIVNGCQTATSLALAEKNKLIQKDARVLLRIYQTTDIDLVDKIVLTTNNQNKITGRNLRANDVIQRDLQDGFLIYNYYYERKPRQYSENIKISADLITPNEDVGAAYLAIVLKKCSDARSRRGKIWGELYDKVFVNKITVESYLISFIAYNYVSEFLKANEYVTDENESNRFLAKNAKFHIARAAVHFWRGSDNWDNVAELKSQLNQLLNNKGILDDYIKNAFEELEKIIRQNYASSELNTVLKSSKLDEDISKMLHANKTKREPKQIKQRTLL